MKRNDIEFKTREVTVIAHPYADITGTIQIPKDIKGEEDIRNYVNNHWKDISFGEPNLDYCGTDIEIEDEEDEDA